MGIRVASQQHVVQEKLIPKCNGKKKAFRVFALCVYFFVCLGLSVFLFRSKAGSSFIKGKKVLLCVDRIK